MINIKAYNVARICGTSTGLIQCQRLVTVKCFCDEWPIAIDITMGFHITE